MRSTTCFRIDAARSLCTTEWNFDLCNDWNAFYWIGEQFTWQYEIGFPRKGKEGGGIPPKT